MRVEHDQAPVGFADELEARPCVFARSLPCPADRAEERASGVEELQHGRVVPVVDDEAAIREPGDGEDEVSEHAIAGGLAEARHWRDDDFRRSALP